MSGVTLDWVKDAVFYQIFPDRFAHSERLVKPAHLERWDSPPTPYGFKGGDLYGVLEHLDYLQDLGVTALYFNPIFASAANHRYHTYDYFNVDPLLGGNTALRDLLDAAHQRHMRLILDGVFNHASRGLWQFHHVLENGAHSPYVDWFHFDPERLSGKRPFAAYPDPQTQKELQAGGSSLQAIGYHAWWNLPALPKFNTDTPAVREFLWNVATHWIAFGIDGWRLDVPAEINDDGFWQEFRRRVHALNPEAYLVGEVWHEARRWLRGDQFDAVMNYPVTMACLGFFGGEQLDLAETHRQSNYRQVRPLSAAEFAEQIERCLGLYAPEVVQVMLNLLDSHDTPRFLTSVGGDQTAVRLALLFLCAYPGAPCVYYGDEIGLSGGNDPDCRRAFPWDPARWDHELLAFFKKCIALRHAYPGLRSGSYERLYADAGVYAFCRTLDGQTLVVILNTARERRVIDMVLPLEHETSLCDVWDAAQWTVTHGRVREVGLEPRSGRVLATL